MSKDNNYNLYGNTPVNESQPNKKSRKAKELNYDLEKLQLLSGEMFPHYYDCMIRLNNEAAHHELQFVSFIYFTKKGLPSGRPYNSFCSTLNPKKKHRDTSGEYRPDFLSRIGLHDYYEVYDIKSEIPRINWLFHTGEWKDDGYDFYDAIIDDYQARTGDDDRIARGKAGAPNYNDSMKQLFMRIYFGTGSWEQSHMGYRSDYMKRNIGEWNDIQNASKQNQFRNINRKEFSTFTPDEWDDLCRSVNKVCGASIGSLVFWYAFFIETEVRIELLNRGKKVYNVYDGFYFSQDISIEIADLLKEKALFVYDKFMKPVAL